MATTTMTVVDEILKEVYEPKVRDQIQSEVKAIKRIEQTSEGVETDALGGKYVKFATRIQRNHGMGSRGEMEVLPAARSQAYATAQVGLAYQYASIELSGQTFELAESNQQAFASVLDQEINGLKEGLVKDANRQVFGTSRGKIATANASGTTTTLVCSNAEAIYAEIGMVVDLYNSSNSLKSGGGGLVISNVQRDSPSAGTATITFGTAAGGNTASGDYITRADSAGKEIVGLRQIVSDTGQLFNIDPSSVPLWKSVMDVPGTSTALSEGRMIRMVDEIRTRGGKTTVIFTSLGVRRAYFNLLSQQRQFVNTKEFAGGFTGLAFTTDEGEIPVVSDMDCPWSTMFFLNEKELKVYRAKDWSFMNRDGSNWQRIIGVSSGAIGYYDGYTSMMYKYWQLATHRRNSHGLMGNITEA